MDLRKLDPVLFRRELRQAEKDNEEANASIPLTERDEEDKAEGYIKMSKCHELKAPYVTHRGGSWSGGFD